MTDQIVVPPTTSSAEYAFEIPQRETWFFAGFGFDGSDEWVLQSVAGEGAYDDYIHHSTGVRRTLSSLGNGSHVSGPFKGRWHKSSTGGNVGLRLVR